MSSQNNQDIEALIANSKRLVAQAREVLAKSEAFFAQHNIDPNITLDQLRRDFGEAAVQAAEAQVQAAMQKIDDEVERQRLHAAKVRPAGKRPVMRSNMV